jgi:hypothetical protein
MQRAGRELIARPAAGRKNSEGRSSRRRNPAFGAAACLEDLSGSALAVPPEAKVQPGRRAGQLLQPLQQQPADGPPAEPGRDRSKQRGRGRVEIEELVMERLDSVSNEPWLW